MRLHIEHHHFYHPELKELDMALSKAFSRQLDRLTLLISADRSNEAATIAKAVSDQAEADSAAIQAAHDEAQVAIADRDATIASLNDELAALKEALDAAGAPAAVDDPTTVQPVVDPASAPNDAANGSSTAQDGSTPAA